MRQGLAILLVALLLAPVLASGEKVESDRFHFVIGETPRWVSPVNIPKADGKSPEGQAVRYLLSDRQVRVDANSENMYFHMALQPLIETGLEEASQIQIRFSPEYQELEIHAVRIIRDGKGIDKLSADKVKLVQREADIERRLYDGVVSALIILDDVRLGDIIEYAYSVKGANPVFGNKHFSSHSLGWGVPVDRVQVRLSVPKNRQLRTKVYNIDLEPVTRISGDRKDYTWRIEDAPSLLDEGDYPGWYVPYPWLQVTEYQTWSEVDHWARGLYRHEGELAPALREKLRQWRGLNQVDAAAEALRFVQKEIRYFGVELGQNSHRPSHPNEVMERRYGDCKDKAVLLVALLNKLGIKAYPALVSTQFRHGVSDWLPSPGLFDHVIVAADIGGNRYWLDGTRSYQAGRLSTLGFPNYGMALPIGAPGKSLAKMSPPKNAVSSVEVEEHYRTVGYEKPVLFTVKTTYKGGQAEQQRYRFANSSPKEISDRFLNYYARYYPAIELSQSPKVEDDQRNNVFVITEEYRIPQFWQKEDGKLYFEVEGYTMKPYTALPKTIQRKMPLAVAYPFRLGHTTVLEYPEDIDYEVGEAAEKTIEDKALSYRRKISYKNRRLIISHQYESKSDAVMPNELPSHIRHLRKINDSLYYSGWVQETTPGEAGSPDLIQELLQRLEAYAKANPAQSSPKTP